MTKEQLSQLSDEVRIPTELFLDHLKRCGLKVSSMAQSPEGGIAFFFENTVDDLLMTADIEIHADGEVSASIIPYQDTPSGHVVYPGTLHEPLIDLIEVQEEPPYEEVLNRIISRLSLAVYC